MGGSLNLINDEGHTAIAYGSTNLLGQINMMNMISSTNKKKRKIIEGNNNQTYTQKYKE